MKDLEVDEELKEKMQSLIESREPEQYHKDITLIHAECGRLSPNNGKDAAARSLATI
jgi:hypothetical protein